MDIEAILKENQELKALVSEIQEKLKRYTNPLAHQAFYEKNKEKIIKESAERLKK
jgi:cell division septum initiation protein DivIVA